LLRRREVLIDVFGECQWFLFKLSYPPYIILQCVHWYVSYALSYRNIQEMMKERGFDVDHAPLLEKKARKYKRPVHGSWRMDETYIKIKGNWRYLYRCVDKYGKTVDFKLCDRTQILNQEITIQEKSGFVEACNTVQCCNVTKGTTADTVDAHNRVCPAAIIKI
jgi:hypothetical protein